MNPIWFWLTKPLAYFIFIFIVVFVVALICGINDRRR